MVDVNKITEEILSPLKDEGVKTQYHYPESFNLPPIISFYELINTEAFRADNKEWSQMARVQIDIWSDKKTEPGKLAIRVNTLMQAKGWSREFSRDLPKETEKHLYHKTMRFAKEIYE